MNNYLDLSHHELTEKYHSKEITIDALAPQIYGALKNYASSRQLLTAIAFMYSIRRKEPEFIKRFQKLLEKIPVEFLDISIPPHPKARRPDRRRPRYLSMYTRVLMSQNISELDTHTLLEQFDNTSSVLLKQATLRKLFHNSTETFPSEILPILNRKGFLNASMTGLVLGRCVEIFDVFGYYTRHQPEDSAKYVDLLIPFIVKNLSHPNLNIRVRSMYFVGSSGQTKLFEHLVPFLYSKEYVCPADCDDFVEGLTRAGNYDSSNGDPVSSCAVIAMECLDEEKSIPYFLDLLQAPPIPVFEPLYDPRVSVISFLQRKKLCMEVSEKTLEKLVDDPNIWVSINSLIMLDKLYKSKNKSPVKMKAWLKKYAQAKAQDSGQRYTLLRYLYRTEDVYDPEVLAELEMRIETSGSK